MLKWLLGNKDDQPSKIVQMLAPGNVGYLSASCCTPSAAIVDEQLVKNLKQAMSNLGLDLDIQKETLTGAQAGMRTAMSQLSLKQGAIVTKVMGLFSTKGFQAFPMLFVDGDIAFYGGVPTPEQIEQHLRAHLSQIKQRSAQVSTEPRPVKA